MIRIAIVEDDQNYAEVLRRYIKRYEEESNQKCSVVMFDDGEDIAVEYKADYDIILMDVEMRFMDGMTSAEKIREIDGEVVIIFITNMPQYAMRGYAVEALDYVIKPINYYAFSQRIDRALGRMKRRAKKYISINPKGGIVKLAISDIFYIEVQNHDLIYHSRNGDFMERGTMKELEKSLEAEGFFRCNKCYLVNLEYVDGCVDNNVMIGKETVQVSRARKKELMDVLNNYMNEVSK